jgi:hypothetical protein
MAQGSGRGPPVSIPRRVHGPSVERGPRDTCNHLPRHGILCGMGTRFVEAGVALAAVLSAVMLAFLLAAPWVMPTAAVPTPPEPTPRPSASAAPDIPPMGLFLMRTPFSFGPCLALELAPPSYPVAEGAEGTATVLVWQRGMTGCDSRSGEVESRTGTTHVVPDAGDPDAPPVGYTVEFSAPLFDNSFAGGETPTVQASLTILARQSTAELLQAVEDAPGSGQGYVLDLVPAVDPPLNPLPTPVPLTSGPVGLYLLAGRLGDDGPCLVLDLDDASYPADPGAEGEAAVRWWEPGSFDPDGPAECLSRGGEVGHIPASVTAIREGEDPAAITGHAVRFAIPPGAEGGPLEVEVRIGDTRDNPDQIDVTLVTANGESIIHFDRVDAIDPPLLP